MFYSFFYPLLFVVCLLHQTYLRLLVFLRLRPALLLKAKIRPSTHYVRACRLISMGDLYSLHVISPCLSALYALHLFEKTRALPYKQGERMLMSNCIQDQLQWRNYRVNMFIYAQPSATAEKILLLHGWDGRSIMLRQLARHLHSQGYSVFAPDLPAHGMSTGKKISFYDLANFVLQLQEQYGSFSVIVGHSTGGLIGCMAALQGLSLKGLVLMSSPSSYGKMIDRFVALNRLPTRIACPMKKIYHLRYGVHPDQIGPALYRDIKQPVLIIHDTQDLCIGMENATELNEVFLDSELFATQGKGHNGALRDPETLIKLSGFISHTITKKFRTCNHNGIFRRKAFINNEKKQGHPGIM